MRLSPLFRTVGATVMLSVTVLVAVGCSRESATPPEGGQAVSDTPLATALPPTDAPDPGETDVSDLSAKTDDSHVVLEGAVKFKVTPLALTKLGKSATFRDPEDPSAEVTVEADGSVWALEADVEIAAEPLVTEGEAAGTLPPTARTPSSSGTPIVDAQGEEPCDHPSYGCNHPISQPSSRAPRRTRPSPAF